MMICPRVVSVTLVLLCMRSSRASILSVKKSLEAPSPYVDVSTLTQHVDKLAGPQLRHHLPECATQQVCNTLFVRMNHTQKLCECSRNYNWECNSDPDKEDGHTIELTRRFDKKVYTQVKLCEPLASIRACKTPTDWTLLALQSERTGKAHYVVVCRCPENSLLDGPYTHNHPPYARIPGIRVYGMLCAQNTHSARRDHGEKSVTHDSPHRLGKNNVPTEAEKSPADYPAFPWDHAFAVLNSTSFANLWQ